MNIFTIILSVLLLPVGLLEYFALLWFWWGDGVFALVAVPVCFGLLAWLAVILGRNVPEGRNASTLYAAVMAVLLPPLTMLTVWGLADLFGIVIRVH